MGGVHSAVGWLVEGLTAPGANVFDDRCHKVSLREDKVRDSENRSGLVGEQRAPRDGRRLPVTGDDFGGGVPHDHRGDNS